jgi:glycosyltransferase involved in cell wall biosynthesis
MPAVSVIVPTCDRPELVGRAVASVLRQTLTDLEVVLVDNNRQSGPAHENPLLAALLADPRVVLVATGPLPNAAAARNAGLSVARGEWVSYLDDDDEYHPEKIASQLGRARETGAQLVLCGYTVILPRRARPRQVATDEFRGDALLLDANWGTPFLFHHRDAAARFDETMAAGEDTLFAQSFLLRHDVRVVPNCNRSLVNVFPQVDAPRVHRDGLAIWRSFEATAALVGTRYSPKAVHAYLATGRLFRAQFGHGTFLHFVSCAIAAWRARGLGAWRLAANATARRTGLLKRWVVS